jgi:hypothetical protein
MKLVDRCQTLRSGGVARSAENLSGPREIVPRGTIHVGSTMIGLQRLWRKLEFRRARMLAYRSQKLFHVEQSPLPAMTDNYA